MLAFAAWSSWTFDPETLAVKLGKFDGYLWNINLGGENVDDCCCVEEETKMLNLSLRQKQKSDDAAKRLQDEIDRIKTQRY
ncbi:hypothetical protein H5410_024058 [Solanum commersonii]|uniref:Uncharacterized protein n=1 Tax=Solanum commersonii TaxID=4109 RepID=A0A9J5ZKW4_SOLCO|nr:hypothetical protein H5410_024058 [Solanum commersonii]